MKKTQSLLIVLFVLLLGMFTFQDLAISNVLFNPESTFGWFFESFGELILAYMGAFSAFALLKINWKKSWWKKIGFGLLAVYNVLTGAFLSKVHLDLTMIIFVLLLVIYFVVFGYLATRIQEKDYEVVRKIAIVGVILSLAPIVIVTLLKMLWGRERYRAMTNPATQFTPWYAIQKFTTDNERMSFPSGHAANSATMVWITLLPLWLKGLKKYETLIVWFTGAWIACVMLSRVIVGAHFASDVLMGATITLMLFYVLKNKFFGKEIN